MGGNETGNGFSSSNKKKPRRGPGIAELERLITLRSQQQQQQQKQKQISPPYNPPVRAALPTQGMCDNETENGSSSSNKKQKWRGPGIAELERQIRRQQQQQMASPCDPPLPPYQSNFNNEVPRLLQMPYSSIPSSSSSSYTPHSASSCFQPNNSGMGDLPEYVISYGNYSLPNNTARWIHGTSNLENQPSAQSNIVRSLPDLNMSDISSYVKTINSYGNSQSSPILIDNIDEEKERIHATSNLENQPYAQSNIPRSLPDLNDSQGIDTKKHGSGSAGSSSQNSESSDTQELDLELRL